MDGNPNDLTIEELEKLLAEKRARQRYSARLESQTSALERGAQRVKAASAARPHVNFMRVGNRVLLAVEIFAVAGLLIAGVAIFLRLQELNREKTGKPMAMSAFRSRVPPSQTTPVAPASRPRPSRLRRCRRGGKGIGVRRTRFSGKNPLNGHCFR